VPVRLFCCADAAAPLVEPLCCAGCVVVSAGGFSWAHAVPEKSNRTMSNKTFLTIPSPWRSNNKPLQGPSLHDGRPAFVAFSGFCFLPAFREWEAGKCRSMTPSASLVLRSKKRPRRPLFMSGYGPSWPLLALLGCELKQPLRGHFCLS